MAITQRQVRDPRKLAPILDGIINESAIVGINGLVKSNGATASKAVPGTDYLEPGELTDVITLELASGESITFDIVNGLIVDITLDEVSGSPA